MSVKIKSPNDFLTFFSVARLYFFASASLFDLEISLPIIAAFLTILGYSLNDTIVVFDRIRENLKLSKKNEDIF